MFYSLEIDDELIWAMALLLVFPPPTFVNKQEQKGNKKTRHIMCCNLSFGLATKAGVGKMRAKNGTWESHFTLLRM